MAVAAITQSSLIVVTAKLVLCNWSFPSSLGDEWLLHLDVKSIGGNVFVVSRPVKTERFR